MTSNTINVVLPHSAKAWTTLIEIAIAQRNALGSELRINLVDVSNLESPYLISIRRRFLQRKISREFNFNLIRSRLSLSESLGFLAGILPNFKRVKSGKIESIHIRNTNVGKILHCRIAAAMGIRQFKSEEVPLKLFLNQYMIIMKMMSKHTYKIPKPIRLSIGFKI